MWRPYAVTNRLKIYEFYTLFEHSYEYGYTFPGETHDFWECVYVMEGSICASGDERIYNLSKNDIIFHKPMELHKFSVTSEKGASLFIFSFSAAGTSMEFFSGKAFCLTDFQAQLIQNLLLFMRSRPHSSPNYAKAFKTNAAFSQMTAIMTEQLFLSFYDDNFETITVNTPETELFRRAIGIMNKNLANSLTISDIAEQCSVSCSQLKRVFNKYSNFGVHKYYLKLKINRACMLLRNGHRAGEVSDALGFCDQNYFSMVFKRETGKAPSTYKNDKKISAQLPPLPSAKR